MNIRDFKDHLFLSKKAHFLTYVKVAAESIGAPIPEVNFEGCTSFEDELAHIHLDQNKICISESYLKQATTEELRDTATHEVAHLIDDGHGNRFVKAHINVKTESWIREHTRNEINPSPNVDDNKLIKSQKREFNFKGSITDRTLVKLRTLYEGGKIEQDEFFDKIKDELVVVNRIIVRIQNDYESGKMGRRVYLDKLYAFEKDKTELETILNPLEPIEDMSKPPEPIDETPSKPLEPVEKKTPIRTKLFGRTPPIQKKTSRRIINAVLKIMGYLTIIGLFSLLYLTIGGEDVVSELPLSTYSDKIVEIWNEYTIPSSTSNILDKIESNEKVSKPQDKDLKSFDEINKFREGKSRFKILWSENVYNLAKFRANDMVKRGYFSHITPDGKDVSDYIGYYNFYADSSWGENLCMDCSNPTDVWIDSPDHRKILLGGWGKGAVACEKNICVFIGVNE